MNEHQVYCAELLEKLVNTPSVFTHEEEIMLFLEREFWEQGFVPTRFHLGADRFNLLCSIGSGYPRLCLNAHADTVPPSGNSTPAARIDGDTMWGLGSCDTKASVAAMTSAFRQLAALPEDELPGSVDLLISVDEEGDGKGVESAIADGYACDFAIVGEPTSLDIVHAHAGIVFLELTTSGVSAHGSTPSLGQNAIQRMIELVGDIATKATDFPSHPAVGAASLNLGEIHAGDRPNRVPDRCIARVDIRIVPPATVSDVMARVDAVLGERDWASCRIERQWQPVDTPVDSVLVESVAQAAEELGIGSKLKGWRGGTEAEPFRTRLDVDAIVLGPGDLKYAHSESEHVSISQTQQAVELYVKSVLKLGQMPTRKKRRVLGEFLKEC